MAKSLSIGIALVAILSFYYFDVVQKHPVYEEHVAPLVQVHVTPLYKQHIEPLYVDHVAPLVEEHVTPLYQQHVAPLLEQFRVLPVNIDHTKLDIDVKLCDKLGEGHLTDVKPIEGFHVLCLGKDSNKISGYIYKEGLSTENAIPFESDVAWESFHHTIETTAEIKKPVGEIEIKFKQPWALFDSLGVRITSISQVDTTPTILYVMEGGQFIWPGIRIGHKRVIKDLHGLGDVTMETLELTPLVFAVEEFLRDDEIDVILDLSMEHLAPSGVTHNDGDVGKPATEWRTSTTYFLSSKRHPLVQGIDQRVEDLVKVDKINQEDVQVLRYEHTQKYDAHLDYFSIDQLTKNPQMVESLDFGYKNRMITVFWYMSDVAKGGHTVFPRAGGKPQPYDFTDCTKGLLSTPKKRKVIIFYSMLPSGRGDEYSLHGGCPVHEGIKYSGNKWIWNKPFSL